MANSSSTSHMGDTEMPSFVRLKHPRMDETTLYPMDFEQQDLDSALKYEAQDGDIFVCTFPKCGTTWMQNIVWLIVHNGESIPGKMRHSIPMLDFDGAEFTEGIDNTTFPRIIKSHLSYSWISHNSNAKYIYVARDPKDALVSFYYHCKGFQKHYGCENLNFDRLFELYVNGEVEFGSYFDHVGPWYMKRNEPNILFVLFEDLKKDIKGGVLKVAKFLGQKYEKALLADGGILLNTVIEKSSLKSMKSQEDKWTVSPRTENSPFVRKGIVGDWKNHLTAEQVKIINQRWRDKAESAGWADFLKNYENV